MNTNEFDSKAAQWDFHQDRVDRANEISEKIIQLIPIDKTFNAMDFGCGTGLLGFNFTDKVKSMTFADTSIGMLEQVKIKGTEKNISNINTLDLNEFPTTESYDLIISLMTLHHIDDTEECIENLTKILVPGGFLCLCDLDAEDGSFHGEKKVPHNGFLRSDIEKLYAKAGLKNINLTTGHINKKVIDGKEVDFPVFIAIGHK